MIVIIIAALSGPLLMIILAGAYKIYSTIKMVEPTRSEIKPFVVSEYFSRIEEAALDILETQGPADQTIILWWGLDGLQLNEDGTLEWISRKKPDSVSPSLFYQPCQSIQPIRSGTLLMDQTQSTKAQIDELMARCTALQMQSWQSAQITNTFQQCCVQYPAQYPPYYYGGCCGNYIG